MVADIAVDRRRIGPVRLDSHDGEAVMLDQMTRNRGTGAIEFSRAVARFTEQHHTPIGPAIEQPAKRWIVEVGQVFAGFSDHLGQRLAERMT